MADGGIGEQPFQFALEHREVSAEQKCRDAGEADQHEPLVGSRKHGPEANQQEDTGLHHGRGMQEGGDRVGAAIAFGNQKWKGNCALFVSAPSKMKTRVGR